jgi:glc operon protein GlcG
MLSVVSLTKASDAAEAEAPAASPPQENVINQPTLTLEGAKRAAAVAIAYARSHGAPGGAIAIVDAGGHTLYLERLDGTFAAAADVSVGKARTAVNFQKPTRNLEDAINKGRPALLPVGEVTWFTPLQGGVPVVLNGRVVGGIGVSGAASQQQDEEIAMAGAQALVSGKKETP